MTLVPSLRRRRRFEAVNKIQPIKTLISHQKHSNRCLRGHVRSLLLLHVARWVGTYYCLHCDHMQPTSTHRAAQHSVGALPHCSKLVFLQCPDAWCAGCLHGRRASRIRRAATSSERRRSPTAISSRCAHACSYRIFNCIAPVDLSYNSQHLCPVLCAAGSELSWRWRRGRRCS